MQPENKQNEQFDIMLKKALKNHQETIRPEFSEKLIAKIRTIEQQNILQKVILQERLLLAGLILFPIAAITIIFAYPAAAIEPMRLLTKMYPQVVNHVIANFAGQWRLWGCYVIAAIAVIYAAYEQLIADN
ncbi:MAG: hypothetical protein ACYC3B_05840 [Sedimentisphaerales bacterium]